MMKFRDTLLLWSFFIHAAAAAPMWGWGHSGSGRQGNEGRYGSVTSEQGAALKRRVRADQGERSLRMPTAIDRRMRGEEELFVDSSDYLINQEIVEAESVAQKWKDRFEQETVPGSLAAEEMRTILQEATADSEYWVNQKAIIDELLSKNQFASKRGELFLSLSQAASEAIQQANKKAAFYAALSDGLSKEQSAPAQLSVPVINPFHYGTPSQTAESAAKEFPSQAQPLSANTVEEILRQWHPKAEVRYDSTVQKYVSHRLERNNIVDLMRSAAARTPAERAQHREAIERIALGHGTDRAIRFKNSFVIRLKKTFGEPLTPGLIGHVQEYLKREDQRAADEERMSRDRLSAFSSFFESIAARWQAFRQQQSMHRQYDGIPENH